MKQVTFLPVLHILLVKQPDPLRRAVVHIHMMITLKISRNYFYLFLSMFQLIFLNDRKRLDELRTRNNQHSIKFFHRRQTRCSVDA